MDPDLIRPGHWSQADAFEAWFGHRNGSEETRPALRGWANMARPELERGRTTRARMHSLDAVSDVLFEPTESDAEFIAVLGDVKYTTEDALRAEALHVNVTTLAPSPDDDVAPEPAIEVDVSAEVDEGSVEL
jgi:hypothetical protein